MTETGTVSRRQPDNTNFLSPNGFEFILQRTPHLVYFCDQATLPAVSLGVAEMDTPNLRIPFPGDKLVFDQLSLRFKVDEDFKNYIEIFEWLNGLGFPESSDQYAALVGGPQGAVSTAMSDGTLLIQTSHRNFNIRVHFHGMIPVSLAPLTFDVTSADVDYLQCDIAFRYQKFTVELLNNQ